MPHIFVRPGLEFRANIANNESDWFKALGEELKAKNIKLTLAPGMEISDAATAEAFFARYQTDGAQLAQELGLEAGMTIQDFVLDLKEAADDVVKATSDVKDLTIDMSPSGQLSKLLGIDKKDGQYAAIGTEIDTQLEDRPVFSALGIQFATFDKSIDPTDPLAGKLYIDSATFPARPDTGSRAGIELEINGGVTGIADAELQKLLSKKTNDGDTVYQKARRAQAKVCEAFSTGYNGLTIDQYRWDTDAHKLREKSKYVALTIEGGRFDMDTANPDRARRLSLGTDYMDDTYYDTKDFTLTRNDFLARLRIRWDDINPPSCRRILWGVKSKTSIDEFGFKNAPKKDERQDLSANIDKAKLRDADRSMRAGARTGWGDNKDVIGAVQALYEDLVKENLLPDVGTHKQVLELVAQGRARSMRSRYHLNETSANAMRADFKAMTSARVEDLLKLAVDAKARTLSPDETAAITAFEAKLTSLKDGSAILGACKAQLEALSPGTVIDAAKIASLMPDTVLQWNTKITEAEADQRKVVAEAIYEAYHALASDLDDVRRVLTGATARANEDFPAQLQAWMRSTDKANGRPMINATAMDPFLKNLDAILALPAAEQQAKLDELNAFGAAQKAAGQNDFEDYEPMTLDQLRGARSAVVNEAVRIWQRQLECGGTRATQLWFDAARTSYVPEGSRNTSNFIIDTFDWTMGISEQNWKSLTEDQKKAGAELPAEKIERTMLMSELQIELGLEKPYIDRMTALKAQMAVMPQDRGALLVAFMTENNTPGFNATTPSTAHAALQTLLAAPPAEQDAFIVSLTAFAAAKGCVVTTVTTDELRALKDTDCASAPLRTPADLAAAEATLGKVKWMFEEYKVTQEQIREVKGEKVLRVLKDNGASGGDVKWEQPRLAKGQAILTSLMS